MNDPSSNVEQRRLGKIGAWRSCSMSSPAPCCLRYDLLKGNPLGGENSQLDPGFRTPVIDPIFDNDVLSRDWSTLRPVGADLLRCPQLVSAIVPPARAHFFRLAAARPVNGYMLPEQDCAMTSSASEVSSMDDYEAEASADVAVSGLVPLP